MRIVRVVYVARGALRLLLWFVVAAVIVRRARRTAREIQGRAQPRKRELGRSEGVEWGSL